MKNQQINYKILLDKIDDFDARTIAINLNILNPDYVIDKLEVLEHSADIQSVFIITQCGKQFNKKIVKGMPLLF